MQGNSYSNLGFKSLTNSAEGAFSAPDALRMRMQEISRSKSALASTQPIASQDTKKTQLALKLVQNAAPAINSSGRTSGTTQPAQEIPPYQAGEQGNLS